jgi:hypothetical protein
MVGLWSRAPENVPAPLSSAHITKNPSRRRGKVAVAVAELCLCAATQVAQADIEQAAQYQHGEQWLEASVRVQCTTTATTTAAGGRRVDSYRCTDSVVGTVRIALVGIDTRRQVYTEYWKLQGYR